METGEQEVRRGLEGEKAMVEWWNEEWWKRKWERACSKLEICLKIIYINVNNSLNVQTYKKESCRVFGHF